MYSHAAAMGKGKVDTNAGSMTAYLAQAAAEIKKKKNLENKKNDADARDSKRQKTSNASEKIHQDKTLKQTTLGHEGSSKSVPVMEKKKKGETVPPPLQDNALNVGSRPATPFNPVGGSSAANVTPNLLNLKDPNFNGLDFMRQTFDNHLPKEVADQGATHVVALAINQALAAASSMAGMAQYVRETHLAKARFEKKANEFKAAYEKQKADAETAAKRAELIQKQNEDQLAGVSKQLSETEILLRKEKSLRGAIDAKHTAAQEKIKELAAKHKRLKESILGRASRQFALGFVKAKEQISIVDPNFDLSKIGFLKEVRDGQVVGDDDIDLDDFPKFDSESEDEEEEVITLESANDANAQEKKAATEGGP